MVGRRALHGCKGIGVMYYICSIRRSALSRLDGDENVESSKKSGVISGEITPGSGFS